MPPPSPHPAFALSLLPRPFKVIQQAVNDAIDPVYLSLLIQGSENRFTSITRTDEEISIVIEANDDDVEANWRCIKIAGPMDFGITGVMCNFTTPLKVANIPVFAVSTWNTDYVLVPKDKCHQAADALRQDGWTFND